MSSFTCATCVQLHSIRPPLPFDEAAEEGHTLVHKPAAMLTVLASLAIHVQGPHRSKASVFFFSRLCQKKSVTLIICETRRAGVTSAYEKLLQI